MKDKYKIKTGNINVVTEETTAVSKISYELENAHLHNLDNDSIGRQIKGLKSDVNSLLILNMLIVTLILLME